jgi:hypothetical protein
MFVQATANLGGVSGGVSLFQDKLPAPAGLTIALTFPATISGQGSVSVVAESDNGPGTPRTVVQSSISASGTLRMPPLLIGSSGMYSINLTVGALANGDGSTPVVSTARVMRCEMTVHVVGNGTRVIEAVALPTSVANLRDAAQACGFIGFNWQQKITELPCPSPFKAADPANPKLSLDNFCPKDSATPGNLKAPPEVNDPPPGGYTYLRTTFGGIYSPGDYVYPVDVATTPGSKLPVPAIDGGEFVVNFRGLELRFADGPNDACLPTEPLTPSQRLDMRGRRDRRCGGPDSTAPEGSSLKFRTALVGINGDHDHTPSDPLFEWTWTDTNNGSVGDINTLSPSGPIDPGSGVGFITITSINGVPVPPIIPHSRIATKLIKRDDDDKTETFTADVKITNISKRTISTPSSFQIVFNSLPHGVTLLNATGTFNESPYLTVPSVTNLAPGESATVSVQFKNPTDEHIKFTPEVYAGSFQ